MGIGRRIGVVLFAAAAAGSPGLPAFAQYGAPVSQAPRTEPVSRFPRTEPVLPVPQAPRTEPSCWRDPTGWHAPDEIPVSKPQTTLNAFNLLTGQISSERLFGVAEARARRWFGFDQVEVGSDGVRLRKSYGGRLTVLTFAQIGASTEGGVRADYRLWNEWFLRSETTEQGEALMELRRKFFIR